RDVVMAIPGPFGNPAVLRGAAVGDFDRDGDLDLVTTENGGPLMLWRNDSRGGRSVRIEPLHASGSPALGARVELYTGADVQQRYIRTGHSYLSSSEAVATFGVGAHDRADSVRIVWPGGATEVWTDVASNRTHRLIQGSTRAAVAG